MPFRLSNNYILLIAMSFVGMTKEHTFFCHRMWWEFMELSNNVKQLRGLPRVNLNLFLRFGYSF